MSGSCSLSIVIFADKQESLEKTIASIQRQPDAKDIQLLIVPVEQAALSAEYQKQPGASENIRLVAPDEAGNIGSALKNACRGRYLTFTKAGIVYKEQLLMGLLSHAAADADVIEAPIAIQEKYTKILREHNAYCRRADRHTTLETNAYLLHNMYMGYFVKADSLCWQRR